MNKIMKSWVLLNLKYNLNYAGNVTETTCLSDCCTGPVQDRSCVFTNLYFFNGEFYILANAENTPKNESIRTLTYSRNPRRKEPAVLATDFQWVRGLFQPKMTTVLGPNTTTKTGTYLFLTRSTPFNWGHTVLDDLLPIYHSLLEHNFPHNLSFAIVNHMFDRPSSDSASNEEILKVFSGNEMQWLGLYPQDIWICFEKFIVGSGQKGARSVNKNYQINGEKLNLLNFFRNRFYERYNYTAPIPRSSSLGTRAKNATLSAIFIVNKRDLGSIDAHVQAINGGVRASKVDLSRIPFAQQLLVFRTTDIYISGVGTAITACFLLPDGAIVINLGGHHIRSHAQSKIIGYWEENIAGSINWVRSLFYNMIVRRNNGILAHEISSLVAQAEDLIRSNFSIPVQDLYAPVFINLSPVGRVVAEYFSKDEKAWGVLTGAFPPNLEDSNPAKCLVWAEDIVCGDQFFSDKCSSLNASFLDNLRKKHEMQGVCS